MAGDLHMTRVEDVANIGRPDVEGCLLGHAFITELKVADRPARRTTPIRTQSPIKKEQVDWLEERRASGGRAWLLVQVGERHKARRYLLDGRVAHRARDGLTEAQMDDLCVVAPDADAESLVRSMAYA